MECNVGREPPDALVSDAEALRRDLPIGVCRVGPLEEPRLLVRPDGSLQHFAAAVLERDSPDRLTKWDLRVALCGGEGFGGAYDALFWVRLRFSCEWPLEPPSLRFLSAINHALTEDDGRELLKPFYAHLEQHARDDAGRYQLRDMLMVLRQALVEPSVVRVVEELVSLPFVGGAPEYRGTLTHPALGPANRDFSLRVQNMLGPREFEGKWELMSQQGSASIILDSALRCIVVYAESPLGDVELNGELEADSGSMLGELILKNQGGGTFALHPLRRGERASDAETANAKRLAVIRKYAALAKHPALFVDEPDWHLGGGGCTWLHQDFARARAAATPEGWRELLKEHLVGEVISFPLFTEEFCDMFAEEVLGFYASGLPARRPNSMNNYGIVVGEIGLEPLILGLQEVLRPLGEFLWPGPGSGWDGHHCFIVRYREGEDLGLDMHVDDSEVTFNVCLGLSFGGAGLQFCGRSGAPDHRRQRFTYLHERGRCVAHLGRHRHGADDITTGERLNLIIWNHSSEYRRSEAYRRPPYDAEVGQPDLACLSYTHDRDFGSFRAYPPGKESLASGAWCPPQHAEYPGFGDDYQP